MRCSLAPGSLNRRQANNFAGSELHELIEQIIERNVTLHEAPMLQLLPKLMSHLRLKRRYEPRGSATSVKGDEEAARFVDLIGDSAWQAHNVSSLLALVRDLDLRDDQVTTLRLLVGRAHARCTQADKMMLKVFALMRAGAVEAATFPLVAGSLQAFAAAKSRLDTVRSFGVDVVVLARR